MKNKHHVTDPCNKQKMNRNQKISNAIYNFSFVE